MPPYGVLHHRIVHNTAQADKNDTPSKYSRAIYSNFALKKWKIHQGESFEGRLTLAPIEKTPPLRRATPVPWSMVHQYSRNAPGTKSQALHVAHTSLIAVIFKGSCAPLYSSPRTKGVKTPDLVFLIWG